MIHKLSLKYLDISWNDYFNSIIIDVEARDECIIGERMGAHITISKNMFKEIKFSETIFDMFAELQSKEIVDYFVMRGSELGLDINEQEMFIQLHYKIRIGLKQVIQDGFPYHYNFSDIVLAKPDCY